MMVRKTGWREKAPTDKAQPLLTRREMLGRTACRAARVALGVSAADLSLTNALWPPGEPKTPLTLLPGSNNMMREHPDKPRWVVFAGLGHQSAEPQARTLARIALGNAQPVAFVTYPNDGPDLPSIAPWLNRYANMERAADAPTPALNVYAESLGVPAALEAAKLARVRIGRLVANCPLFSIEEAHDKDIATAIAICIPRGGLLGDLAYNLALHPLRFVQTTYDGAAPQLWTGQMREAAGLHLLPDEYKNVFVPGQSEALICAPINAASDGLVNDPRAEASYDAFFDTLGVPHQTQHYPEPGHANTQAASLLAKTWLEQSAAA